MCFLWAYYFFFNETQGPLRETGAKKTSQFHIFLFFSIGKWFQKKKLEFLLKSSYKMWEGKKQCIWMFNIEHVWKLFNVQLLTFFVQIPTLTQLNKSKKLKHQCLQNAQFKGWKKHDCINKYFFLFILFNIFHYLKSSLI